MMSLTWKDARTTLFVAGAVTVYALAVTGTAFQGMSIRVVTAIVFGLGIAACMSNGDQVAGVYAPGPERRVPMAYVVIVSTLGAAAIGAGVIAIVAANEAMLATLVAAVTALWVISTVRHAIAVQPPETGMAARPSIVEAAQAGHR
jgi:hypothetical protein